MSTSKFIMATKLARVQKRLMELTINDDSLDGLIPLIFKECLKEDLTFWFNFLENEVVLNLRDIGHENYELNIRQYHGNTDDWDSLKKMVLTNTFLITKKPVLLNEDGNASSEKTLHGDEGNTIISSDQPVPKHVRDAITRIQDKGIPVTPETIRNHLPTGQMSTSEVMKCNKYLKEMKEASL